MITEAIIVNSFPGNLSRLDVEAADYEVIETDLPTQKTKLSQFNLMRHAGTNWTKHFFTDLWDHVHTVRKNTTERSKNFTLDISVEQSVAGARVPTVNPFRGIHGPGLLLILHFKHVYFDQNDWIEMEIKPTQTFISGNESLDLFYPQQLINIATNNSFFVWYYALSNELDQNGFLFYHRPRSKEQKVNVLVNIEKANDRICGGKRYHCSNLTNVNFAHKCLDWKSVLRFSHQIHAHWISLPGNQISLISLTHIPHNKFSSPFFLHVYWPTNFHSFQKEASSHCQPSCRRNLYHENHTSFNFSFNANIYHYVQLLQYFCDLTMIAYPWPQEDAFWVNISVETAKSNGSWNEASLLCKSMEGTLPIIRNRKELDQILALCKYSLSFIEIMFIGLVSSAQPVSVLRHENRIKLFPPGQKTLQLSVTCNVFPFQHHFVWQDGHFLSFQLWKNYNFGKAEIEAYRTHFCLGFHAPCISNIVTVHKSHLLTLKDTSQRVLYPQREKSSCVVMLLINLAKPEWITVDCEQSLSAHVVCVVPQAGNKTFVVKNFIQNKYNQTKKLFVSPCLLLQTQCFLFSWVTDKICHNKQKCSRKTNATNVIKEILMDTGLNYFKDLLDALPTRFPAILNPDLQHVFNSYKLIQTNRFLKSSSVYQFTSHPLDHSSFQGYFITTQKAIPANIGTNLFECQESFISQMVVCDDQDDCPDRMESDENQCVCPKKEHCKKGHKYFNHSNGLVTCSYLYSQHANGLCVKYSFDITTEERYEDGGDSQTSEKESTNKVKQTAYIKENTNKAYFLSYNKQGFCQETAQFPCAQDLLQCYDILDLCIFKLLENTLFPCTNGEHLTNCDHFECNMKFKCPEGYCIPWAYVCNGKWDCPFGLDEDASCPKARHCINMFKCKNAGICVHLIDVCDKEADCPLHDDEQLCSLKAHRCAKDCQCLAFAIQCNNIVSEHWQLSHTFPWHAVFVEKCSSIVAKNFLSGLQWCSMLVMKKCRLIYFCELGLAIKYAIVIDVGENNIKAITRNCFGNLKHLKTLRLDTNNISELQPKSLYNVSKLQVLDLSRNKLLHFYLNSLCGSRNIQVLILRNISISEENLTMLKDLELKYLSSSYSPLCCAIEENTACEVQDHCIQSCTRLLTDTTTKVFFCSAFIVLVLLNILSAFLQRQSYKKQKAIHRTVGSNEGAKVSCMIIQFLNLQGCSFSLYFGGLFVADQIMSHSFPYLQNKWKASSVCFSIFVVYLWNHLVSPSLLTLFTLSRLMVVVSPLNTRFKDKQFVRSTLVYLSAFTLVLTLLMISLLASLDSTIANKLCSSGFEVCHSSFLLALCRWIILVLQIVCAVLVAVLNIKLLVDLKAAHEKVAACKTQKKSVHLPIGQCVTLTTSHIICWLCASLTYTACSFLRTCRESVFERIAVTTEPLNGVVVPVVFIVVAGKTLHPK